MTGEGRLCAAGRPAPGPRARRSRPRALALALALASAAATAGGGHSAASVPPAVPSALCAEWTDGRGFSARAHAEVAALCAQEAGPEGRRALQQQAGSSSRQAVTNTVDADGASTVRAFGYKADGTAVEGLRAGPGGAELFYAEGQPLSALLGPLAALVQPQVEVPAAGAVALSGSGSLYFAPKLVWPHLPRGAAPLAASAFTWSVSSADSKLDAAWEASSGRVKLTSTAAASLGGDDFPPFDVAVSLSAAAAGVQAAAATLTVRVRPMGHSGWERQPAGINDRRLGGYTVACGGKLYLVGCGAQCYVGRSVEEYDPKYGRWRRLQEAPLVEAAGTACGEDEQGRPALYLVGGTQKLTEFSYTRFSGYLFARYRIAEDRWEALPDTSGVGQDQSVVWLNGIVYVTSVYDDSQTVRRFDTATMTWLSNAADVPVPVWGASVVAVGAHLYLYGGRGRGEGCPGWCNYNRLYRYDPSSNTWARMADAPGGENSGPGSRRGGLAADPDVPLAEAKIYMHKAMEDAVYAYSVAGDTWETYAVGMNDAGGNSVKRGGGMSGLVALHGRLLYVSGSRWNYATGSWDEWTNIVDVR